MERFWSKVDKGTDPDSCWEWQGALHPIGRYGTFYRKGGRMSAHRQSWELVNGPIPDGLLVCHHCDNPPCVRPDHLFLGTNADNYNDSVQKGRRTLQARRTHCNRGHELTPDNLDTHGTERRCKTCRRVAMRRYDRKRYQASKQAK